MKLQQGDKAPFFKLFNQKGEECSLLNFDKKKLIIFFYPKDNTPGCTREACDLRDNYDIFSKLGYCLLGVSCDNEESHKKFILKYNLPFNLLCDIDQEMVKDYGVWGLKKFMGREYEGIHRISYLINEDKNIEQVYEKVKTKTHAQDVLLDL